MHLEYSDPTCWILHPLFQYTPSHPSIYYNLQDNPLCPNTLEFFNLQRQHNDINYTPLTTQSPASSCTSTIPYSPGTLTSNSPIWMGSLYLMSWHRYGSSCILPYQMNITGMRSWGEQERVAKAFWDVSRGIQEEVGRGLWGLILWAEKLFWWVSWRGRMGCGRWRQGRMIPLLLVLCNYTYLLWIPFV